MLTKPQEAGLSSVIGMLRRDHKKVKGLFEHFEQVEGAKAKQRVFEMVSRELEVHSKLEEELIYPAIRAAIDDDELMNEAVEEHHVVEGLIGKLKKMKPGDNRYDAQVTALAENVKHHIKEEELEMLPNAEGCDIAWEQLYSQVAKRKQQLLEKIGAISPKRQLKGSKK